MTKHASSQLQLVPTDTDVTNARTLLDEAYADRARLTKALRATDHAIRRLRREWHRAKRRAKETS